MAIAANALRLLPPRCTGLDGTPVDSCTSLRKMPGIAMNGTDKTHRIYKSHSRRSRRDSRSVESEANLETELNVARTAGSDHGVGAGHVGRRRRQSERV